MTNDYQPVSCELHSQFELAIMHRQKLLLNYLDSSGQKLFSEVLPVDIQTKNGAEFLVFEKDNTESSVRLDHILKTSIL